MPRLDTFSSLTSLRIKVKRNVDMMRFLPKSLVQLQFSAVAIVPRASGHDLLVNLAHLTNLTELYCYNVTIRNSVSRACTGGMCHGRTVLWWGQGVGLKRYALFRQ